MIAKGTFDRENWIRPAAIARRAQDIRRGLNGSVLGSTFFGCTGGCTGECCWRAPLIASRDQSRAQSRWALFMGASRAQSRWALFMGASRAQSRWALFACLIGPGIQFSSAFLGLLGFQLARDAPRCCLSLRPPRSDDRSAVLPGAPYCYVCPTGLFRRRTHVLVRVSARALLRIGPSFESFKGLRIEAYR